MEEKEYNTIIIDNIEYTEIDRIRNNNNTYIFLSNLEHPEDFLINKLIIENEKEYIISLDDEEEFTEILRIFTKKYTD